MVQTKTQWAKTAGQNTIPIFTMFLGMLLYLKKNAGEAQHKKVFLPYNIKTLNWIIPEILHAVMCEITNLKGQHTDIKLAPLNFSLLTALFWTAVESGFRKTSLKN